MKKIKVLNHLKKFKKIKRISLQWRRNKSKIFFWCLKSWRINIIKFKLSRLILRSLMSKKKMKILNKVIFYQRKKLSKIIKKRIMVFYPVKRVKNSRLRILKKLMILLKKLNKMKKWMILNWILWKRKGRIKREEDLLILIGLQMT